MTIGLIILLVVLAVLTAALLTEGFMAGFTIGIVIFVPFFFLGSMLFARMVGLDQRIRSTELAKQNRNKTIE